MPTAPYPWSTRTNPPYSKTQSHISMQTRAEESGKHPTGRVTHRVVLEGVCLCVCISAKRPAKSIPGIHSDGRCFNMSVTNHSSGRSPRGVQVLKNYLSKLSTLCHTLKSEHTQQLPSLLSSRGLTHPLLWYQSDLF